MAGSSLFLLIDDIATLLDDVAVLSKVAVNKTAGVMGDDLALNAQQVTGLDASRELPVVASVAWGSAKNKAILVPMAMIVSATIPWAIIPGLMLGGLYLCFEGVEKLAHKFLHSKKEEEQEHTDRLAAVASENVDMVAFEKDRIQGAVRTDFVLSAEIIVITMGTIAHASLTKQLIVLIAVSIIMTIGVYGLVAGIVKLDDLGFRLCKVSGDSFRARWSRRLGRWILWFAPYLLKFLSVAGTIAMFLVGGGILTHNIPPVHDAIHHLTESMMAAMPSIGWLLEYVVPMVSETLAGMAAGAVALVIWISIRKLWKPANAKVT